MALTDRKQREFERREEDILDAALELFSQPGWDSVTVQQIAKSADIGKGTVYKHFASKDELVFRLMLRFYQGLLGRLQEQVAPDMNFLDFFRKVIRTAFHYHLENKEYRYIVEHANGIDFKERADEAWRESFNRLDQAFDDWGTPLLEKAMADEIIERRPVRDVQLGMHACFEGAVTMLWAGRDWCVEEDKEVVIEAATSFILAGLTGQPDKG